MFEVICYDYTGEPIDFLVQWDTGTTIEIRNIDLPETPIIHFSNKFSEKSLALRDGVVYKNKTLTSPIPDVLLQEPYMLTVYVYAHEYDKNRGKTTNIAKLPIMAKPKPIGYVEKQTYEGINVLALKVNVDKNTKDIIDLKYYDTILDGNIGTLQGRASSLEDRALSLENRASSLEDRALSLEDRASKNESAIDILNGTEEGSVNYKITEAFNSFVANTSNDNVVNTYKELVDYAAEHASEAADFAKSIQKNAKDISDLSSYVGTIPASNASVCVIDYVDGLVTSEANRATNAESAINKEIDNAKSCISTNEGNIDALELEMSKKVNNYGWSGNLFLGTDSDGNVVPKSALTIADSNLSPTSTNPIQNKIVAVKFEQTDAAFNNYYTSAQTDEKYSIKASEHFHSNQDALDTISHADIALWNATSGGGADAIIASIFNAFYPIGSIYMSTIPTNPSSIFGGTWEAWGNGRVPVGVDPNDSAFNTVEKTGGAKTHTLTVAEMPAHTHNIYSTKGNYPDPTLDDPVSHPILDIGKDSLGNYYEDSDSTSTVGSGSAHNNLQPYITCYMWKRVA